MSGKRTFLKYAIIITIGLLLVGTIAQSLTIRLGTDSASQGWNQAGMFADEITNQNGKSYPCTADGLQDCIDDAGVGGFVFIPGGNHSMNHQIHIGDSNRSITIVGVGRGSGYLQTQDAPTTLYKAFNGELFNISFSGANSLNSFHLNNFAIKSNNAYTGGGIYANYGAWFSIENLVVDQCNGTGICIDNARVNRLQNIIINGDSSQRYDGHGIRYRDSSSDAQWYYIEINYNNQSANHSAIQISGSGLNLHGGHLEGWQCINTSGGSAVRLDGVFMPFANERCVYSAQSHSVHLDNCLVYGANYYDEFAEIRSSTIYAETSYLHVTNCIVGDPTTGQSGTTYSKYGIYLTSDADECVISNNLIYRTARFLGNENMITGNDFRNNAHGAGNNYFVCNRFGNRVNLSGNCVFIGNSYGSNTVHVIPETKFFSGQNQGTNPINLITNSRGKSFNSTIAGLRLAINDLNGTFGDVYIPYNGEIDISTALYPNNVKLIGAGNTTQNHGCLFIAAGASVGSVSHNLSTTTNATVVVTPNGNYSTSNDATLFNVSYTSTKIWVGLGGKDADGCQFYWYMKV